MKITFKIDYDDEQYQPKSLESSYTVTDDSTWRVLLDLFFGFLKNVGYCFSGNINEQINDLLVDD